MDIKVNLNRIKEMCGTVSYKKGSYFYRANKVTFNKYNFDLCEATVSGTEDFQVTIKKDAAGNLEAKCSCPSLANFQKDCQHVAAVLLSIHEHQRKGTIPDNIEDNTNVEELTKGFLSIFHDKPARTSAHQLHFEKREVLDVRFTCRPVQIENGHFLFGIELEVSHTKLKNIRTFLHDVKHGRKSALSSIFTYDPNLHCISKEADVIMQELIGVIQDERAFLEAFSSSFSPKDQTLLIPPSSWVRLASILTKTSLVSLEQGGHTFESLKIVDGPPPIQFAFEVMGADYQLAINGFDRMIVLNLYRSVLFEGKDL